MSFIPKGWSYSRSLPHYDTAAPQFITFRLYGSLPEAARRTIEEQSLDKPFSKRDAVRRKLLQEYLDRGLGQEVWLRNPDVATAVQNALLFFDGSRYELHAWVIMPNHVHVLITPGDNLDAIVGSWKAYTAVRANRILKREGRFWQKECFDRFIRNERQFINTINYIHLNPVTAGLCDDPEDWRFSSASLVKQPFV